MLARWRAGRGSNDCGCEWHGHSYGPRRGAGPGQRGHGGASVEVERRMRIRAWRGCLARTRLKGGPGGWAGCSAGGEGQKMGGGEGLWGAWIGRGSDGKPHEERS
ncbi:hypothetical protein CLOP_g24177 [Closterium sp. NIES-67]|nr:hypothetical protein CLOP_g24177 [Closterium sp. NIES-67]